MTTDAGAVPAAGRRLVLLFAAVFAARGCWAGQGCWWPVAVGSQPPCLPTPQLMTFSQRPVADTQDPHLPQGTAATGTAVLAAPNSLSALGISTLVRQEQPLYPETLSAASAKPENSNSSWRQTVQRTAETRGCAPAVINQHVSFHWVTVQHGRGALDS